MKRLLQSGRTTLVVIATIALLVASFVLPGRRHEVLDAYVLFLGAVALAAVVAATRAASPDVHEPSLSDRIDDPLDVPPERPRELERLEREVYLALGSSFYLHHRLRPALTEIAAHRMLTKHGVDLQRKPEAARQLLGETAWAWLEPGRPEPRDRWATGPPIAELRDVVDALERI
jgi:hypothetical protein